LVDYSFELDILQEHYPKALDEIQRLQSRVQEFEIDVKKLECINSTWLSKYTELEAEQRWIPVSDRLPEDWKHVLVATKYDVKTGCVYQSVTNDIYWTDGEYGIFEGITHWKPLPQPPKEGE